MKLIGTIRRTIVGQFNSVIPVWIVFWFILSGSLPCYGGDTAALTQELLRNRIEAGGTPPRIVVERELIHATVMLPLFYERRGYEPAWCENMRLKPEASDFLRALRDGAKEGLNPCDNHTD